jgi:hypothetical protein
MASSYTTSFGIEKIATGEQAGSWGTTTNHNADILDRIAAYTAVALSGTTHTLTVREASPGSGTENLQDGMYRVIKFTGALGANNTVTIAPNTSKAWFIVENATTDSGSSGPYSVILTQGSGANITVQNGKNAIVYCDGAGSGAVVYNALADIQVGTLEVTGVAAIDGVTTHGDDVVSDTDSTDDLGTTSVRWANLFVDGITATDQITATGFTGTLDGILGSGAAAAATVTTLTTSGVASVDDTTDTTSGTTGSIHTDGGLGVAKNLFVATNATVSGTTLMTGVATHGDDVVSDTDSTDDLGTTGVRWANLFVDAITATDQITATGFTGTLDGILGSGTAAAASVTTLNLNNSLQFSGSGATSRFINDGDVNVMKMGGNHATQPIYLDMVGEDDGDNETIYGSMRTVITADADGSEVGYLQFAIMGGNSAGALTSDVLKIGNGCVFGGPTGGEKGYGTLNCTGAYDDNSLLSCFPFDQELDGTIDNAKWDAKVPDRTTAEATDKDGNVIAAAIIERTHEGMRKFKARIGTAYDPLDIDKYAAHWKAKRHLTSMPNEKKYDSVDGTLTTGEWIQRLLETVEIQAIHIEGLNQRLKALEA